MSIDDLVKRIKQEFEKVLVDEEDGYKLLTIFERGEPSYLLCLSTLHTGYYYGKVVSIKSINIVRCYDLLYYPLGLYIFGRSIEEFLSKLKSKLKWL
ncbi:MAG: hypothetical protein ABWW65_03400 [Thermoprotei archaeon]